MKRQHACFSNYWIIVRSTVVRSLSKEGSTEVPPVHCQASYLITVTKYPMPTHPPPSSATHMLSSIGIMFFLETRCGDLLFHIFAPLENKHLGIQYVPRFKSNGPSKSISDPRPSLPDSLPLSARANNQGFATLDSANVIVSTYTSVHQRFTPQT